MDQPQSSNERSAQDGSSASSVDYDALMAEALDLNHETFEQRADRAELEADPEFANDLRFAANVATSLNSDGKRTLAVGGYARDEAIARESGIPQKSKDLDMEIYGMEFEPMVAFLQQFGHVDLVGAAFGIAKLKNPETGGILDFSIPRADSKVDKGHKGFQVTGDPTMTVREAARRRDLTINSLALDPLTGEMVDEYGGLKDIKDKVLRATDPELFGDDPLRSLRVMQFAGRFNFAVDPATADLCRSFDLTELPKERIGEEWLKLMTKSERPSVGIAVARNLNILQQLHPELAVLETIEQEPDWHPEGNVLIHSMQAADAAAKVVREEGLQGDEALVVLFGALVHDYGKATTTEPRPKGGQIRITAHGHEQAGVKPAEAFLKGLKLSNNVAETILPIVKDHLYHVHNPEPTDKQLLKFAGRLQPANIRLWDMISRCDSNARQADYVSTNESNDLVVESRDVLVPRSSSYNLYERSLDLQVSEAPVPRIVGGGDVIKTLGIKKGPSVSGVVEWLYDAQLDAKFNDVDGAMVYARAHSGEMDVAVEEFLERKRQAREAADAERRARTELVRALPRAERQRIAAEAQALAKEQKERIEANRIERERLNAEIAEFDK